MKLLLDTHVWIWSVLEPKRLSRKITRELADPQNELWLSPISVWETLMLCSKNRLELDGDPCEWIRVSLQEAPIREAPLTVEVALALTRIRLPHRDPADAFLAASASVYGLTLVTADAQIATCKDIDILMCR